MEIKGKQQSSNIIAERSKWLNFRSLVIADFANLSGGSWHNVGVLVESNLLIA